MGSDREQPSPPPGREPALDAILAALADGPVVIEGEAGIGKTRLLDAVMERSSATRVVAVVATEGTADLGFGSLAPVLDIVGGDHPSATLAAVVDQLTPLRSSERVLLVVDDAHWLDRRSAAAIRLAAGRGAPTLLACRRGEPLPPDVAALARTGTSVELGRLPADALGALARAMLERTLHPTSLAELAANVDTLVSVAPSTAATDKAVNADVLAALGPDGVFVNIGRGGTVDQPALIEALGSGTIGAAGLDVFADEPVVPQALIDLPNACLLPHVGSATVHTRKAMADLVADNLVSWFEKGRALTPVPETANASRTAP